MFKRNKLNIWESVSDMMTGMMMIFIFVSLAYMLQLSKIPDEYYSTKSQIVADLSKEFPPNELEKMGAQIDEQDGTISFTADGTALFEAGKVIPTAQYQAVLNNFFPRYMNILQQQKYQGKIVEIRIEGHASVEANEDPDNQYMYFYNMYLSQNRARSVLEYVMRMPYYQSKEQQDWMKQYMTAIGYSFSRRKGDVKKDRRVDFRVILNTEETMQKMQREIGKEE